MFRKPKKKPSALRGKAGGSTGGAFAFAAPAPSAGRKRRRARSSSSSSEEDDDGEEGTSGLLEQLRRERDDARSRKSSGGAALLNTSSTSSKKKSKDGKNSWMHQYKSGDGRMTAQEMATRTAEYHPTEKAARGDDDGDGTTTQNANIAGLQKQPRNKFLAGPLRATTFVRTTARFDYQPDICKDYKETGFCGFGDTCIYLHDRGDTKAGWQMEAEYEEKKKREEERKSRDMENFMKSMMYGEEESARCPLANEEGSGSGADDGIPFACHICRGAFKNPVVTSCGHYFCEACMLDRTREAGTGCPICRKDTHGVMNHPQKLIAKKRRLVGRDGTWEEYLERSKKGGGDGDDAS